MKLLVYPDARFSIYVLKVEYAYGCKPKELLLKLDNLGWKENGVLRNPLIEMPGCMQEYSIAMDSGSYNAEVLSKTKILAKEYGTTVQVLNNTPKGRH